MRFPRLLGQQWGITTTRNCLEAMKFILRPGETIEGPAISQYENLFARQVGVHHAVSFVSGRVAFYAFLKAIDLREGDEVLLQVPTHIVVANAIRYAGGVPVYVDCGIDTFNMDLDLVEKKITPRSRVLLIQHTFGIPADMGRALDLARKHNLVLIEDCVHALGAEYGGRQAGSMGAAAFFSTEETKIISSTMGGMAVTDDTNLAEKIRAIQAQCAWPVPSIARRYLFKLVMYHVFTHPSIHTFTRPLYMYLRRYPSMHLAPGPTQALETEGNPASRYLQRLTNGQAAVALRQLQTLESNLQHRRRTARAYHRLFEADGHAVVKIPEDTNPSFVRYPLSVSDRLAAVKACSRTVILGQWFNTVLEESASPIHGGYSMGSCPVAELLSNHLVNLPTHYRVREVDISDIVAKLKGFVWKPQ